MSNRKPVVVDSTQATDGDTPCWNARTQEFILRPSGSASYPNIAALLKKVPTVPASAYVASVKDFFDFDTTSTLTADGITVLAPKPSSPGRWLRRNQSHRGWAAQTTWWIDYTNGNDENDGTLLARALKTPSEWRRRIGAHRINQDTTVWINGDIPATEPIIVDVELGAVLLNIRGVRVVTRVGTTTASAFPTGGASHVSASLTDSGIASTWTAEANALVSEVSTGYRGWIESDLGSKKARTSYLMTVSMLVGGYAFVVNQFTTGLTYQVLTLPTVAIGYINLKNRGGSDTVIGRIYFDGLRISSHNSVETRTASVFTCFVECRFDSGVISDANEYLNCLFMQGATLRGGRRQAIVGGLTRGKIDMIGCSPQILGFLSVGGQLAVSQGASPLFACVGVFNVTGDALAVSRTSWCTVLNAFGGIFYGNGNTGYGVAVSGGSVVGLGGSITCTGTSGDFKMQGSNSVRSINSTTGAVIGPLTTSWANYNLAQGSSGFGGIIQDLASGCQIVPAG